MNELVTHTRNRTPGNLRVSVEQILWDIFNSLADHFERTHSCLNRLLIGSKLFERKAGNELFYILNILKDVFKKVSSRSRRK